MSISKPHNPRSKARIVATLRDRIADLEQRRGGWAQTPPSPEALDAAPPWARLRRGAVHEIWSDDARDAPSALGFGLAQFGQWARAQAGAAIWVQLAHEIFESGAPYGLGLRDFGVDLERFVFIRVETMQEALWAAEEALNAPQAGAVLIDTPQAHRLLNLTTTRRLSLAAARSKAGALIMRNGVYAEASAAETRWRVRAAPSASDPYDTHAPKYARWRVNLERARRTNFAYGSHVMGGQLRNDPLTNREGRWVFGVAP